MRVMPLHDEGLAAGPSPGFVEALVAELPRLRRVVAAVVGPPGLRDDVLQETLVRACRSWESFDPARPMAPWLRRIVLRARAELDERERRAAAVLPRPRDDLGGPGSDDHVVALDRRRQLRQALGALSPRDRTLLLRREVDELPYEVLAALTGGTEAGTRKAADRARDRLRVAYLAVVEAGRGGLVAVAAAAGRLRHRAASRSEGLAERLLPLVPASVAVVVVTALAGVGLPAALVVRAAAEGTQPDPVAGDRLAGASSFVLATGTPPSPPSAPAGSPPTLAGAAPRPPVGLRAGPAGAGGGLGLEQPTPANDAIWYQGVEVRCDRSTLLASTCAVLRATPAGDGLEVEVPTE